MAEYMWIHQRFDSVSWRCLNSKRVQKKLDQIWIHQFSGSELIYLGMKTGDLLGLVNGLVKYASAKGIWHMGIV